MGICAYGIMCGTYYLHAKSSDLQYNYLTTDSASET